MADYQRALQGQKDDEASEACDSFEGRWLKVASSDLTRRRNH